MKHDLLWFNGICSIDFQLKYLNGTCSTEAKDKRHIFHPNEDILLRERGRPKSLRTQYQVLIDTKIRRNKK